MPTYSYFCSACGREFECEQRISEPPIKKCTSCGKSKARRMIMSGNFILKGSGWYSDGYSKKFSDRGSSSKTSSSSASCGASEGAGCGKSEDGKKSAACSSCDANAK